MRINDKKLVLSMAIGDGYIRERNNSFSLCIRHCAKQEDYIRWKALQLSLALSKPVNVSAFNNSGYPGYRLEVNIPYLKFVKTWIYSNSKKRISLSSLRRLNDLGVAIWYMDDGSLYPKKRNNKVHAYELCISTCCSEQEAVDCISFFKERYDTNFSLKRNKGWFSIRCGTREAKKLLNKISMHIIPCMHYKTFQTVPT